MLPCNLKTSERKRAEKKKGRQYTEQFRNQPPSHDHLIFIDPSFSTSEHSIVELLSLCDGSEKTTQQRVATLFNWMYKWWRQQQERRPGSGGGMIQSA